MDGLYDTVESTLIWGSVIFTIGLVVYLGYLQYLKMKYRHVRRRRRSRRTMTQPDEAAGDRQPSHNHQS